jgi:hypothetical protein
MSIKDTNPKDALGIRKVGLSNVPCGPLFELGLAMLEGGCKYGTHNYREAGVRYKVYYDSTIRHMMDWWEGEDIDPDSGVHHVVKAIAGLMVLRDSMLCGNDTDDRPLRYPSGLPMAEFNKQAGDILDKYPDRKEPYTQERRDYDDLNRNRPLDMSELVGVDYAEMETKAAASMSDEDIKKVCGGTEKLDGARQGVTVQQVVELAEMTLKDVSPISSGSSLTDMPKLEPPIVLPDNNMVRTPKEQEAVDINISLPVEHPDREFYCGSHLCFKRGKPNGPGIYDYYCPKHPLSKGDPA